MATNTQVSGVQTRLSQKSIWPDFLLISTSVVMYGLSYVPIPETPSRNRRSIDQINQEASCSFAAGTILNASLYPSVNVATATNTYEKDDLNDNYIVKAPVVKEFKMLIASFKINKSLPKVFAE
jgi:hypothetical protein